MIVETERMPEGQLAPLLPQFRGVLAELLGIVPVDYDGNMPEARFPELLPPAGLPLSFTE